MSKPIRPSAARLAVAVLIPLAVLAAVYYSTGGQIGGTVLRLTAEMPSEVTLNAEGATSVDVKLALTNRSGKMERLSVADPCKVLRWVVQAPGEATVQSRGDRCASGPAQVDLAAGETLERVETLPLVGSRYTPGVRYTVYIDFYGQLAKAEFEAAKTSD